MPSNATPHSPAEEGAAEGAGGAGVAAAAGRGRLRIVALLLVALVVAVDQASKWAILALVMDPPRVIPLTGFFNLVLVWNRGMSFGFLNQAGGPGPWLVPLLACAIVTVLLVWLWRTRERVVGLGLGLIIGGAVGNLIDRARFGAVVDFVDLHVAGVHWPAFNVADAAITVGALLIVIDSLLRRRETA